MTKLFVSAGLVCTLVSSLCAAQIKDAVLYDIKDGFLEYNVVEKGAVSSDKIVISDTSGNGITTLQALRQSMGTIDKTPTKLSTDVSSRTIGKAVSADLTTNDNGDVTAIKITEVKDRPVIGISWKKNEIGEDYQRFAEAFERNGAIAVFLPQIKTETGAKEILNTVNGVFTTGGEDWNPKLYNEKPYLHGSSHWNDARDTSDIILMRQAVILDVPMLAVCRGEQGFNVALGGALIQDIPTYQAQRVASGEIAESRVTAELDDTGAWILNEKKGKFEKVPCKEKHRRVQIDGIVHGGGNGYHELVAGKGKKDNIGILKSSKWLYDIFQSKSIDLVATAHHQAADPARLGEGLTVAAWSKDGIVEALEHKNSLFALAIQWHPERDALGDTKGVDVDQERSNVILRALVEYAGIAATR